MNRHRELAQMMRVAAPVGGLPPNISHIQFTEGTGYLLADTGDAGLDAYGAVFSSGTSWSTESGKDILICDNGDHPQYLAGWHQRNDLDSYLIGADVKFSMCAHVYVNSVPDYTIGMLFSKYSQSECGACYNFYCAFETNMKLRVSFYKGNISGPEYRIALTDAPLLSVGQWGKIVVTYDGSQDGNNGLDRMKLYLDGVEVAITLGYESGTWPFDMGEDPASPSANSLFSWGMALGPGSCRRYGLRSKWADAMFFDRVLTPAQAAQYAGGF